jgi:hypothetical protein
MTAQSSLCDVLNLLCFIHVVLVSVIVIFPGNHYTSFGDLLVGVVTGHGPCLTNFDTQELQTFDR